MQQFVHESNRLTRHFGVSANLLAQKTDKVTNEQCHVQTLPSVPTRSSRVGVTTGVSVDAASWELRIDPFFLCSTTASKKTFQEIDRN